MSTTIPNNTSSVVSQNIDALQRAMTAQEKKDLDKRVSTPQKVDSSGSDQKVTREQRIAMAGGLEKGEATARSRELAPAPLFSAQSGSGLDLIGDQVDTLRAVREGLSSSQDGSAKTDDESLSLASKLIAQADRRAGDALLGAGDGGAKSGREEASAAPRSAFEDLDRVNKGPNGYPETEGSSGEKGAPASQAERRSLASAPSDLEKRDGVPARSLKFADEMGKAPGQRVPSEASPPRGAVPDSSAAALAEKSKDSSVAVAAASHAAGKAESDKLKDRKEFNEKVSLIARLFSTLPLAGSGSAGRVLPGAPEQPGGSVSGISKDRSAQTDAALSLLGRLSDPEFHSAISSAGAETLAKQVAEKGRIGAASATSSVNAPAFLGAGTGMIDTEKRSVMDMVALLILIVMIMAEVQKNTAKLSNVALDVQLNAKMAEIEATEKNREDIRKVMIATAIIAGVVTLASAATIAMNVRGPGKAKLEEAEAKTAKEVEDLAKDGLGKGAKTSQDVDLLGLEKNAKTTQDVDIPDVAEKADVFHQGGAELPSGTVSSATAECQDGPAGSQGSPGNGSPGNSSDETKVRTPPVEDHHARNVHHTLWSGIFQILNTLHGSSGSVSNMLLNQYGAEKDVSIKEQEKREAKAGYEQRMYEDTRQNASKTINDAIAAVMAVVNNSLDTNKSVLR